MKKTFFLVLLVFLTLGLFAGGGQEEVDLNLPEPAGEAVSIDGAIAEGEYDKVLNFQDKMFVYLQIEDEVLHLGAVAQTTGWIALGLGSAKMDGAHMLFGFVEEDGTVQFEEHLGKGWSHSKTNNPYSLAHALTLKDGVVTLEVSVPLEEAKKAGGNFIYAYGPQANFTARHNFRGSSTLPLE